MAKRPPSTRHSTPAAEAEQGHTAVPLVATRTRSADREQRHRFEEAARELGVELDEETLKEALRKIAPESEKAERAKIKPKD